MTIQPERILLVRPSALGDVCRTAPVAASLRAAFPGAVLDWVIQEEYVAVAEAHPAVNRVIGFPRSKLASWWRSPKALLGLVRWLTGLGPRRGRYDLVVDAQGLLRSGVMSWATRAPVRIGYRDAREGAWLAYTHRTARSEGRHAVDAMLGLLESIGIRTTPDMRLYIRPADEAHWGALRNEIGAADPYAVLAPGSKWASKRWPEEGWIALCGALLERGLDVVVVGSPGEAQMCRRIVEGSGSDRVVTAAGRIGVGGTLAAIRGAALVIANDSAPLHMAVGLDRPLIGLFGPTDPAIVGPYGCARWVVRHPAAIEHGADFKDRTLGDRLMRLITPDMVRERIDEALAEAAAVAESHR